MTTVTHNQQAKRFEVEESGETAVLTYQMLGDDILVYEHTRVPKAISGQGIGTALVKYALDYARDHDFKVVPQCFFVSDYIENHPEYNDLVAIDY